MKNKKGFTLIELLAVIVVLAIIALIATPIVMNTIKSAKKGAAERSADSYINAVETAVATAKLDGKDVADGTYQIDGNGNLTGEGLPDGKLTIEMNGNKSTGGTIMIKSGNVSKSGTKLVIGDYNLKYKDDKLTAIEPYKGVLCKANTTKATALVWAGNNNPANESSYTREEVGLLASEATSKYDVGVTYTCELGDGEENTFYVLETSGDNVSLIAGMNLGATVAWATEEDYIAAGGTGSDRDNSLGPITANKKLKERTSAWTKLDEDQITLPSGQQIATASGKTFDASSTSISSELPTWLSSHTKFTTGTYGYWTSTPSASNASNAWFVTYDGHLFSNYVNISGIYSLRSVITVSKSNLS